MDVPPLVDSTFPDSDLQSSQCVLYRPDLCEARNREEPHLLSYDLNTGSLSSELSVENCKMISRRLEKSLCQTSLK